ncbi:MAG: hydantoinase B/oxoprolinase family protein [Candidatus Latescibacteria bacterium]|nr:hydantoinase B/oxoprolinase family protein [Candidatus Latescibacterota bacterium]
MDIDPITLAVMRGSLEQVADEMDAALERMAFSPVISDGFDRASGIYDRANGEVIVQGPRGLPNFIYVMEFTVRSVIDRIRDPAEGDIYIVNDPYLGGTHLMDVKMVKPFFHRGRLVAYLANSGHWPDIGGRVPGGFSTQATEIYQEGLRLPPVRLFDRGRLNRDVLDIILHNVRVPEERQGDVIAQVTSLNLGAERLARLLDRYGEETVFGAVAEMKVRSEQLMRSCIETIPDGTYVFEDHMDSDGVDWRPLKIHLEMEVRGSGVHLDFSRSSPPCRGPLNSVLSTTMAGVYIAFKHFFPDVPINAGCFRPFTFSLPTTTFLNAQPPRPVSGCAAEVCQRIIDVVLGALSQAIPERCYAAPMGTVTNLSVGGEDPARGYYVFYSFIGGGYGGNYLTDGLINGNPTIALARTQALEIFESRYPILFTRYAIREGSGGAGMRRGGLGVIFEFQIRRGEASASLLGDRGRFAPFGVLGGRPAQMARHTFVLQGKDYCPPHITKDEGVPMQPGDLLRLETPGGGGYGDPLDRPSEQVLQDVRRGYYDQETARREYGVVILEDQWKVDEEGTARLRAAER